MNYGFAKWVSHYNDEIDDVTELASVLLRNEKGLSKLKSLKIVLHHNLQFLKHDLVLHPWFKEKGIITSAFKFDGELRFEEK